jgi:hypothetical protein
VVVDAINFQKQAQGGVMAAQYSPSKPSRSQRSLWGAGPTLAKLLILLIVAAFIGAAVLVNTMPNRVDDQQTIVLGQTTFVPDSLASVRVLVRDFASALPVSNADIRVALAPKEGGEAEHTLYAL